MKVIKRLRIWIQTFLFLIIFPFLFSASADAISVNWFSTIQDINVGGFQPGGTPWGNNTIIVNDGNFTGLASITILVNSTSFPSGIPLTLYNTISHPSRFTNHDLIYTNGTGAFDISSTQSIGVKDTSYPNDPAIIDTIISGPFACDGVQVFSSTDPDTGIYLNMTETGLDTSIYTSTLKFTTGPSINGSAITVHNGDIVSIINMDCSIPDINIENELVTPNPDLSTGALPAKLFDNVTAIYKGVKAPAEIKTGYGGGGGGGGFIRPSLVLDLLLGAVGGSPYVVSPPSFGGGYYHYTDGLTLVQGNNKTTFDISQYNQEIPKQILISGDKVNMTFKTYENYNSESVIHMGLYFIPKGAEDMITTNSIGSIVYDKNSPLEVNDLYHVLSHISASTTSDGKYQYTTFSFTPTKSYDKMSFLVRAWNDHMYSTDTRIYDAVDLVETVKTLPVGVVLYTSFNELEATLEKEGFYKPGIMAHIHDTDAVFSGSGAGTVYWLYDTINHTVTMVVADTSDNELASSQATLKPYKIETKVDYKFMYFTEDQLNRWDVNQEQRTMGIESAKAMFMAAENGLLGHRNW